MPPLEPHNHPPRHRLTAWIWLLVIGVAIYAGWRYRADYIKPAAGAATAGGTGRGGRGGGANQTVPVVAATATNAAIPIYLRGLGTVTPAYTVTLHTRVDGQVMAVHFQEGQMVKKGDLLVEVDPRPYQAALAQAQGQLAHDTALYNDDMIDLERYQNLYKQNIVAKQQVDSQAALVNEYKGAMASDQAAIQTAQLNLNYSNVTAPISGRIGLRLVDPGNIVHSTDQNGFAVITQVQPIAVLFNLPQVNLPQVLPELNAGQHPPVAAFDATNTKLLASGTLLTIDNTIDPTTGTFRCKAMFDNADNALFPNQFVNARLHVGDATGLTVVPPAALQQGPTGTYVFVVADNDKVATRNVTVQLTEGNQVGISSGLAPGENVVVDGADKLQDGSKVAVSFSETAPAKALADTTGTPAAGTGGGRHGGRGGRGGHQRNATPTTSHP